MESKSPTTAEMSLTSLQDILIEMSLANGDFKSSFESFREEFSTNNKTWNTDYFSVEGKKNKIFFEIHEMMMEVGVAALSFYDMVSSFVDSAYEKVGTVLTPSWIVKSKFMDYIKNMSDALTDIATEIIDFTSRKVENINSVSGVTLTGNQTDDILFELGVDTLSYFDTVKDFFSNAYEKAYSVLTPSWIVKSKFMDYIKNMSDALTDIAVDVADYFSKNDKGKDLKPPKPDDENAVTNVKDFKLPNVKELMQVFTTVQLFKTYKKELTDSLDFITKSINAMVDSLDVDKSKTFITSVNDITKALENFNKVLKPLGTNLLITSAGFLLLSLVPLNPLFVVSLGILAGFTWLITKIFSGKEAMEAPENMIEFSAGLGVLSVAMIALQFVEWASVLKMSIFITAVSFALSIAKGSNAPKEMLQFSYGIGILTLSMIAASFVPWKTMILFPLFTLTMVEVFSIFSKNKTGTSMTDFSMSIGILTLSLLVFSALGNSVWVSMIAMVSFIAGIGLALRTFKNDPAKEMIQFSAGIGILTLSLAAFQALGAQAFLSMIGMVAFIAGIGIAMRTFKGNAAGQMIQFATGIGILTLSLFALKYIDANEMFSMVLFIGGIGLAMRLFPKDGVAKMMFMAGGIALITLSLIAFKAVGFDWTDGLTFVGTLAGIAGVMILLGATAAISAIGAGVLAGISVSMLIFAGAIYAISLMKINPEQITNFENMIVGISMVYFHATPYILLGVVGASLFVPIAVSGLLAAGMLMAIAALEIDKEKIDSFSYGMKSVAIAYAENIGYFILGTVASVMFLPIAAVSLASAGVLKLISMISIDQKNLDSFEYGMVKLVDTINSFGIVQLGKAMVKAKELVPVMKIGLEMSQILKNLSEAKINPSDMESFADVITTYVDSMAKTLNESVSKIKNCDSGIEAIAKITGVGHTLVDTIHKMANLEVVEHEVKNGQLAVKKVTKFDVNDAPKIASNIGLMIQALVDPMMAFATSGDEFKVGGRVIKNPFSKKNKKALDFLQKIGEVYKPITDAIASVSTSEMLQKPEQIANFRDLIYTATDTISYMVDQLGAKELTDIHKASIESISNLVKSLNGNSIKDFNTSLRDTMTMLTDSAKWSVIEKTLDNAATKINNVSNAIKTIDMGRVAELQKMLKLFVENNNNEKLTEVLEKLLEVLGLMNKNNGNVEKQEKQQVQQKVVVEKQAVPVNQNNDLMQRLIDGISDMTQMLSGTNSKLGGVLKVKTVGESSNSL